MTAPSTGGLGFLSAEALRAALPLELAVAALERAFGERNPAEMESTPRSVLPIAGRPAGDEGELLLMPAHGPDGVGLKLVTIVRGNRGRELPLVQGLYVLMTPDGMTPELVIDGAALTGLRTAAVSALATKLLARPDSRRLVVFGAGAQAAAHASAMCDVLPIEHVTVVGSTRASPRAAGLVEQLRSTGVKATVGDATSVSRADVICTCTTSQTPLFDDAHLPPGVHINAIGAYRLDMCELPVESLARAELVVESIESTLIEAGDVVDAIERGALPEHGFARELHDVLNGTSVRNDDAQITIFKSVGLSGEDLVVARAVADALAVGDVRTQPGDG